MANDSYRYDDDDAQPRGKDNLFLWTVFILLLIGVAFACWLGSFYIFGHPENPKAYRILKKLHKLEAPKRFEVTAAPRGDFSSAQKLYERYGSLTRLEMERENGELLRNYINNYRDTKKLVAYIRGRFNILDSYALKKGDFFETGVVALAQAAEYPKVLIEHVYPSAAETVPMLENMLQTGLGMSIERTLDLSAIIHVERIPDGRLMFTVVPLLYGTYALKQGEGTFGLEPPEDLNPAGGVPITKPKELQDGLKKYADFRRQNPPANSETMDTTMPVKKSEELVRLDAIPEGAKVPETGALPPMPVATPIPLHAAATPRKATPPPLVAMLATPRPVPVATPIPLATPIPRMSPQGVPLTPFIAANPAPGLPDANSGKWRTYAAGKLPPGRTVDAVEAASLAGRGDLGEKVYLSGQFVVTASGESTAILRPQSTVDPSRPAPAPTRIIVEFPAGYVPPAEGKSFARDASRAFEVRDVRRGADGQINIYVREVIGG